MTSKNNHTFILKKFKISDSDCFDCGKKSIISETDEDYSYCYSCFDSYYPNYNLDKVLEILNTCDPVYELSVSKKIQYILLTNKGKLLTAQEIYEIGRPWNITGYTPMNTLTARCSTLYRNGYINKKGIKFYI